MGFSVYPHSFLFSGEGWSPGSLAQRPQPWAPAFAGEQGA